MLAVCWPAFAGLKLEWYVEYRVSTTTGNASEFSHFNHRRRRRKHRMPVISRASSFSSITDSTMSLNIITVELSMGQ